MPDQSLFRCNAFAILSIARTQHGLALIHHLLHAGLRPAFALISAETDDQLARSQPYWSVGGWRERFAREEFNEISPQPFAGTEPFQIEPIYLAHKLPYLFVPGFNNEVAYNLISRSEVDTLLLAETQILKGPILNVVAGGLVNLHAAPLPEYRGSFATFWALYHDEPLSVTAHLVDQGVDTGPILGRKSLPVRRGDSLEDITQRGFERCAELAVEVMSQALQSGIPIKPQSAWQGKTFRGQMPAHIIEECERRLQGLGYSHYE
jgi:hypothetical protein